MMCRVEGTEAITLSVRVRRGPRKLPESNVALLGIIEQALVVGFSSTRN